MSDSKAAIEAEADRSPLSRGRRELRALSWSTASTLGSGIINLGRAAILSRLLPPEQFGLFGLVFFALSAASILNDGMGRFAVVASFEGAAEQRRFLNTSWTVGLARSAVLYVLISCFARPYAQAIHQADVAPLLTICGTWLLISALESPGAVLLYRQLEQRSLALRRLGTDLFGFGITAVLAYRTHSASALVLGWLAGTALSTALSYAMHPYRPMLAFDRQMFRRGFAQGRHIAVAVSLTFVTTQVDNLIVGQLMGAAALGIYLFAYRVATLPIEYVQAIASSVAMPAYLHYRSNGPAALAAQLRRVLEPSTALLCAALLPVVLLRREIVALLGGTAWIDSAPLLPPLLLLAVLRCTCIHLGTLLQSMERAELEARAKILEAALFIPGCIISVKAFGLLGASWTGAAVYALAVLQRTFALRRVLPGQMRAVTLAWGRAAVLALGLAAPGLFAESLGASPLWVSPVAAFAYVAAMLHLEPTLLQRLRQLLLFRTRIDVP